MIARKNLADPAPAIFVRASFFAMIIQPGLYVFALAATTLLLGRCGAMAAENQCETVNGHQICSSGPATIAGCDLNGATIQGVSNVITSRGQERSPFHVRIIGDKIIHSNGSTGLVWYLGRTIDMARDPLQSGQETYVAPPYNQRRTIDATATASMSGNELVLTIDKVVRDQQTVIGIIKQRQAVRLLGCSACVILDDTLDAKSPTNATNYNVVFQGGEMCQIIRPVAAAIKTPAPPPPAPVVIPTPQPTPTPQITQTPAPDHGTILTREFDINTITRIFAGLIILYWLKYLVQTSNTPRLIKAILFAGEGTFAYLIGKENSITLWQGVVLASPFGMDLVLQLVLKKHEA
jgi:hypothetical protein